MATQEELAALARALKQQEPPIERRGYKSTEIVAPLVAIAAGAGAAILKLVPEVEFTTWQVFWLILAGGVEATFLLGMVLWASTRKKVVQAQCSHAPAHSVERVTDAEMRALVG